MNILDNLQNREQLTSSERTLSDYIIYHTEEVLNGSIYMLAQNTNTSTSSIVRLCQKIGFSGFKDFKIALARDFELFLSSPHNINTNIPFNPSDTDLMISRKISTLTIETIGITQGLLTTQKLNAAVKIINESRDLYGIGVSDTFLRLEDFRIKLLRINRYLKMIDLQAEQYHLTKNANEHDVAIIVSNSGRTAEIVNDAKLFYTNKTPIIAITRDSESPLAKFSTILFQLPQQDEEKFQVSNFSSQLAIEYILNVLYSCIFNSNFEENVKEDKGTPTSRFDF